MKMKTLKKWLCLVPYGINCLAETKWLCDYSMRMLCDLNEDGMQLLDYFFGNNVKFLKEGGWGPNINNKPVISRIMLTNRTLKDLLRFILYFEDDMYWQIENDKIRRERSRELTCFSCGSSPRHYLSTPEDPITYCSECGGSLTDTNDPYFSDERTCINCDAIIHVDDYDLKENDTITCPYCSILLKYINHDFIVEKPKKEVLCPYCHKPTIFAKGKMVCPDWDDLYSIKFYLCRDCDAYCRCYEGTNNPLGTPANKKLRRARLSAYKKFNAIWESGKMSHKASYKWLANALGINVNRCYIRMFDYEMCARVIEICKTGQVNHVNERTIV